MILVIIIYLLIEAFVDIQIINNTNEQVSCNFTYFLPGLTLPTSVEPIYTKAKGRNKKSEKRGSKSEFDMIDEDLLSQDENKDPRSNKSDNTVSKNNKSESMSRTESKKNKKNRRDWDKDQSQVIVKKDVSNDERTPSLGSGPMMAPAENDSSSKGRSVSSSSRRKKGDKGQLNCTTGM